MLVKSLVTGTILTLLAGGVVYYGTSVAENQSELSHPHASKDASSEVINEAKASDSESTSKNTGTYHVKTDSESKRASDTPSLKAGKHEIIKPNVKKSVELGEIKNAASNPPNTKKDTPTRKWIDQYLKSESKTEDSKTEDKDTSDTTMSEMDMTEKDVSKSDRGPTELETQTEAMMNAELEAMETEMAAMEAEIEEFLAQEEAADKEMAALMAKMKDTDRLQTVETETGANKAEIITGIEIELFSDEEILEAEAKDLNEEAKNIENIWISKDDADADADADADSKTLREILNKHHNHGEKSAETDMSATPENDIIDLGDSKMIILKAENIEGFPDAPETEKQKVTTKVAKDGETIYCVENHLNDNVYKFPGMENHHNHTAHDHADKVHAEHNIDISNTVSIIMAQAEKITMPELRDRAYLDLVSYALENNDMESANIALSKIEQVELRDTARNRIAVNYAENGNAEKAFAILGDIEVDALRDVMRLQVIEALIAPEMANPQDMQ